MRQTGQTRAKLVLALTGSAVLLAAAAASPGCRWGDRDPNVKETSVVDGVSVLEYNGLHVYVKRAADAPGLYLVVNSRVVDHVQLHVGDGFVITDGQRAHQAYHLLAAGDDRLVFKREEMVDRRAAREGIRTVESVIAVPPYNLEDTD
jgi:hypothetical protein